MHRIWILASGLAFLITTVPSRGAEPERQLKQADERRHRGLYKSALKKYESASSTLAEDLVEAPDDPDFRAMRFSARWGALLVLEATGEYGECEKRSRAMLEEEGEGRNRERLRVLLGDLMRTTGRPGEALKIYDSVLKESEENLSARLGRGYAFQDLGKVDEAYEVFEWFVGYWATKVGNAGGEMLETVARAAIEMGVRDQDLYLDAQRLLETCEKKHPERQGARVALARLYMNRYARAHARPVLVALFKENPNHPAGRAAMAFWHMGSWANKDAAKDVDRSLKVNPNLVEGLLAKAALAISDQGYREAVEPLKRALAVNPIHLEVLSTLAASHFMLGEKEAFEAIEKKIGESHPKYGGLQLAVGNLVSSRRRLEESIPYFEKAIEIDPQLWSAYFALGLVLSRKGDHKRAREEMEKGYAGDQYNVQVHNLLKLFDAYDEHFVTRRTPHFQMLFHKSEAAMMEKYCGRLLEEGWEALTKKYKFKPAEPVFSEMFSQHQDFAVRTMGFPGLGALGACFGPLITLDSPRSRPPEAFNWASTTWHEFAHVVTVQLSKGRVPRWFTEGLSVYEERHGRPNWLRPAHRKLLGRLKAGKLRTLKVLNEQFTRGDVLLAYFHASWVVEFIEDVYGFDAIIEALKAYGEDLSDEQVFLKVLEKGMDELDVEFKVWLAKKFAHIHVSPLFSEDERRELRLEAEKNPGDAALLARFARACLQNGKLADAEINAGRARKIDPGHGEAANVLGEIFFVKKRFEASEKYFHEALAKGVSDYNIWLRLGSMAEEKGDGDKAITFFEQARDLFPEYVGPDCPYLKLRVLYGKKGLEEESLKALEAFVGQTEHNLKFRLELADIYEAKKTRGKAIRNLQEIHEIWPFRLPDALYPSGYFNSHLRLGRLLAEAENWEEARFEAGAALIQIMHGAKKPEEEEEVEVRVFLAECLIEVGEGEEAASQLEEVLEFLSPGHKKAQELMNKLKDGG